MQRAVLDRVTNCIHSQGLRCFLQATDMILFNHISHQSFDVLYCYEKKLSMTAQNFC